jgi:hypothetical protein
MSNDKIKKIKKYNFEEENSSQPKLMWITHNPRYEIEKKNRISNEGPSKKKTTMFNKKT